MSSSELTTNNGSDSQHLQNVSQNATSTPPPTYREVIRAVALTKTLNSTSNNNSPGDSDEKPKLSFSNTNAVFSPSPTSIVGNLHQHHHRHDNNYYNVNPPPRYHLHNLHNGYIVGADNSIAFSFLPHRHSECEISPSTSSLSSTNLTVDRNEWRSRAKRMAWYSIFWLGWVFCGIKALIIAYRSTSDIKDYKASIKLSRVSFVLGKLVIVIIILLTIVGRARLEMNSSQQVTMARRQNQQQFQGGSTIISNNINNDDSRILLLASNGGVTASRMLVRNSRLLSRLTNTIPPRHQHQAILDQEIISPFKKQQGLTYYSEVTR